MSVTVLVPVYSAERFIAECAKSLFAQTYADVEYVFCNDCTPDNSIGIIEDVLQKFPSRKEHVRIIHNSYNMGTGASRKLLVEAVHTDSFCFVDADDILLEDAIEILVRKMKESGADVVDGAYCTCCNGQRSTPIFACHRTIGAYRKMVQASGLIRHQLWGRLYSSQVLKYVPNLFIDGVDMAEDYCAITRLVADASRAWVDDVVYLYRVEQQSYFAGNGLSEKNTLSYLRATLIVLDYYTRRGRLPLSVEIGVLRAYRQSSIENKNLIFVDETLQYHPQHMAAKLLYGMLHSSRVPFCVTDLIYRIVRLLVIYL